MRSLFMNVCYEEKKEKGRKKNRAHVWKKFWFVSVERAGKALTVCGWFSEYLRWSALR